jgi:3-hexulose-6-phosphate synthase/6-phospho-3-hexuloisomerase
VAKPGVTVQVSLDVETIEEARILAEIALEAGVDWLEAGTPLLYCEGLASIRALRAAFPTTPLVADMKVVDGGYYFGRMVARAGATHLDVMASAHEETLRGAGRAAAEFGITTLGDLMLADDLVATARRVEACGMQYAMLHLGAEHRRVNPHLSALDGLDEVRAAVSIPIQVVGGLSAEQAAEAVRRGADSVVIGGPILPGDRGPGLRAAVREIVLAVREAAGARGGG